MKKFDFELVICIVNSGFSESVMDTARSVGARGGTVINAKGTANKEAETFFKIFIQPEKELVMILVPTSIKEKLLHALYKAVGLDTPGQGIAFALPVDNVVGLTDKKSQEEEGETQNEQPVEE
ncbi:MAG: P-II family nitrogen regulator [Clostridia bacterium]|nr:P-II family nitrogen regulator [Clostridia bacterium]